MGRPDSWSLSEQVFGWYTTQLNILAHQSNMKYLFLRPDVAVKVFEPTCTTASVSPPAQVPNSVVSPIHFRHRILQKRRYTCPLPSPFLILSSFSKALFFFMNRASITICSLFFSDLIRLANTNICMIFFKDSLVHSIFWRAPISLCKFTVTYFPHDE